jgi:hypothetical protein
MYDTNQRGRGLESSAENPTPSGGPGRLKTLYYISVKAPACTWGAPMVSTAALFVVLTGRGHEVTDLISLRVCRYK